MSRMRSGSWHALRRLSWPERRAALHALLVLTGVRMALASLGFRRTQSFMAGRAESKAPGGAAGVDVELAARAMRRAAGFGPWPPTCLPQALALWWLLRRQGLAAELRIGTRRVADRLEAHAWVEHDGLVLNDHADVHERFFAFGRPI